MRIAQLTCVYPPYGGGIGYTAYHTARLLAQEHEVTVFTPRYRGRTSFMTTPGVTVHPLHPMGSFGNAAVVPQLLWKLKKFDAVHLHCPWFGAQEWLWALPKHIKLILTYHMVPEASGVKGVVFKVATKLIEPRLARRAQLLITQTQDYLETVALPRMGQAQKWRIVTPAVEERYTPGEPPNLLAVRLKIPPSTPIALFVGSLDDAHAFKGVEVLLRAFSHLRNRTWRLVVVGKGNKRPQYEALARELQIHKQVVFTGFVPEAELPDYFRLASVFVLPSTNGAETFGIVLLQAMACAKPVIASRLPGVREVVQDHVTGMLTNPGDALNLAAVLDHLLGSPAEARAMGVHGAEQVEQKYRWHVIGRTLRQLYNELT